MLVKLPPATTSILSGLSATDKNRNRQRRVSAEGGGKGKETEKKKKKRIPSPKGDVMWSDIPPDVRGYAHSASQFLEVEIGSPSKKREKLSFSFPYPFLPQLNILQPTSAKLPGFEICFVICSLVHSMEHVVFY